MSTIKERMNFSSIFPNLFVHFSSLSREREYQYYRDTQNWRVKLTQQSLCKISHVRLRAEQNIGRNRDWW